MSATRTRKNTVETVDFETSLKQLTVIIEKMESGHLSLEDSLSAFEEGVTLIKKCQQALTSAEQKIEGLTEKSPTNKTDKAE